MEYNKLVAVSGLPGLYELISSKTDGALVRSLDDKITKFAASRKHQFSHLESIEIYTVKDNVNLADVFKVMDAAGENLPDVKDDKAIKSYFQKVYADMDFDRVYSSDMKKIIKWFDILKKNDIEIKLTEQEETENEEEVETAKEDKKDESAGDKPSKAKKETTIAGENEPAKAAGKKTPAKKSSAPKKKD